MSQWEYCRVMSLTRDVTEDEVRQLEARNFAGQIQTESDLLGEVNPVARIVSLRFLSQPRETAEYTTDLGEVMTRLGREGWELVSHSSIGGGTELFFKRPLAGDSVSAE